jgi:hypothetical protein
MTVNSSGFFAGTVTPPEVNSTNELVDELTAMVATATTAASTVAASAALAAGSATNAGISETNVATLAQQATTSLTAANAAIAVAQQAVTDATTTLTAAEASATAAAGSATAASGSASTATTEATAASNSASAALASQTAAAGSASTATAQASSATVSAGTASSAATAAAGSASAAQTSATTASNEASAASTSAGASATSASGAAASATAAANSAGNSLTYSTNAGSSATASAASAAAAAASAASISLPLSVAQGGLGTTSIQGAVQALGIRGKNRIINGTGVINQRGNTAFGTTAGSLYGGPDRWMFVNGSSGAGITQSQGSMTINGVTQPSIAQTVTTAVASLSAGNYLGGLHQRVEGFNAYDLMGQPVTLQFWFKSSVAGTYSVALLDGTSTNSCVEQFTYTTASTPQFVTITFPAIPSNAVVPFSNATGLQIRIGALNNGTYAAPSGSLGAWTAANYITGTNNAAWASTVGNVMQATLVQLEAGTVATAFETEDPSITYLRCLRYHASNLVFQGTLYITTAAGVMAPLPIPMRAIPTVGAFTNLNIYGAGSPTSPGVVNTSGTTTMVAYAQIDWASSSGSVGLTMFATASVDAEL